MVANGAGSVGIYVFMLNIMFFVTSINLGARLVQLHMHVNLVSLFNLLLSLQTP